MVCSASASSQPCLMAKCRDDLHVCPQPPASARGKSATGLPRTCSTGDSRHPPPGGLGSAAIRPDLDPIRLMGRGHGLIPPSESADADVDHPLPPGDRHYGQPHADDPTAGMGAGRQVESTWSRCSGPRCRRRCASLPRCVRYDLPWRSGVLDRRPLELLGVSVEQFKRAQFLK